MRPAIGPWSGRKYFLDKMTLRDLVIAYFTYYGILVYLLLATAGIVLAVMLVGGIIAMINSSSEKPASFCERLVCIDLAFIY